MRYVAVNNLKKGMLIARDIHDAKSNIFLREGMKLANKQIEQLGKQGFAGAYILDVASDDIVSDPIITAKEYLTAQRAITKYMDMAYKSSGVNSVSVSIDEQKSIVMPVLETLRKKEDHLLVETFDIKPFAAYEPCHAVMVMVLSLAIGMKIGMSDEQLFELGIGALLHDIGTAFLPENILNRPGKLTDEEYELVKGHVKKGYEYLMNNYSLSSAASIGAMQHHESYDGTGYPDGLRKKNISVFGRIIAITDVYDALVSKRAFRAAMYPMQAIDTVQNLADRKFDPEIVNTLSSIIAPFPLGSVVYLKTGETCIVKHNYPENLLHPLLRIFDIESANSREIDMSSDPDYKNIRITKIVEV
jgi:HD-GYP domain-containing protein (c-di-GMP phosphodiesterase class II)